MLSLPTCSIFWTVLTDNQDSLKSDIKIDNLLAGAQTLEDFAYSYPNGTRIIGSPGHNDTIYWLKDELEATGYYDVALQTFSVVVMASGSINAFTVDGANVTAGLLEYSASGAATAPLVPVANLGCDPVSKNALEKHRSAC